MPRGVYSAPSRCDHEGHFQLFTGYLGLEPATRLAPEDPCRAADSEAWNGDTTRAMNRVGYASASALPRVRLVTNTQVSANPAQAIHQIDIRATALVDKAVEPLHGPPGTAVLVEDRPGRIIVETTSEGAQLLVLSENYHSGWQAVQEGRALCAWCASTEIFKAAS